MRPPTLPDPNLRALSLATADGSDELARAELCGLLVSLWLAPPGAALRQRFQVAVTQSPQPGGRLESPWGDLVAAALTEHDALFHGVGQPEVMAHGSFDPAAGDDFPACHLEQQRRFFRQHLQPWWGHLCAATAAHPRALVWRAVAGFTDACIDAETQVFDLLEN